MDIFILLVILAFLLVIWPLRITQSEELREQRAKLIAEARGVLEKAEVDNREPSAEERQHFDKIMGSKNDKGEPVLGEAEKLLDRIERIEKIEKEERDLAVRPGRRTEPDRPGEPAKPSSTEKRAVIWEMRKGRPNEQRMEFAADSPIGRSAQPEYRDAFNAYLRTGARSPAIEQRVLQADVDDSGGFLLAPQQMAAGIIKAVDDQVFMRGLAHIETLTSADSLGAVSLDADPDDSDWTGEITSVTEDTSMDFGKRELNPHLSTKLLKISTKLLRKSPDVAGLATGRLGYKFAITEEKGFLTGSGALQPLGVFTASDDGISTGRDVSTGNTTTTIGADNLREVKYNQKAAYWPRLQWIFHRDAVKMISILKDGEGRYIWQQGITAGDPDRILTFPVNISEYAPSTFTTGLYVGILGDFDKYWIAQSLSFTLQRLVELYAATNQVGFIGRMEVDGMPVLEEAFSRVTLA